MGGRGRGGGGGVELFLTKDSQFHLVTNRLNVLACGLQTYAPEVGWKAMSATTKVEMNADKKKKRILKTEPSVETKKPKTHDVPVSKVCILGRF